jgi:hypothetical protein
MARITGSNPSLLILFLNKIYRRQLLAIANTEAIFLENENGEDYWK